MNIFDLNCLRRGPYELNTSIELVNFLFFDIETTGLKANRGAKIIEIALIDRTSTVFYWTTNRTESQSIDSRNISDLSNLMKTGVIVGHNINFDLSFIAYEAERMGIDMPQILFCDTMTLAKKINLKTKNYKLETLINNFNIVVTEPMHTALVDAQATRAVFWSLLGIANIATLGEAKAQKLLWSTY